ncbi:MAG: DEAD/DEAH box helicase [Deltaproteobacteria bacterium]|nr:MAG: DEAD/DEAH box helicase [Deltaproteobacteria bacterium]
MSALHCLIGAMAFYACGQYSRAFVLISNIDGTTPSAGLIASFLKKERANLIIKLNQILLAPPPKFDESNQFDDWALTICVARSISLASEHAISGNPELLKNADTILHDALEISAGGLNSSFWWIARILRLMLKDYGNGTLWSVLPPFFGPDGKSQIDNYVKLLAFLKPSITELWKSQIAALHLALNQQNRGGVINLRTSAGKTRVAELAILQTLKTNPTAKVLYLAPFRSLAFELERTFSKTLSPLGYQVSHLYGGSRFSGVDRELVNEGHITIATPEKAKAMLRAAPEIFESVKLIIIDEGHLLGENERNVRNELFLESLRLLALKNGARILLLSAVLPNAADLASWIGGDINALVKSDWKPSTERFGTLRWTASGVAIEWLGNERCFNPHFVELKQIPKGKKTTRIFPKNKTEAVAATAVRLTELGPVLIFAGQARWVPSMAKAVLQAFTSNVSEHLWPETEWKLFEAVCKEELGDNSFELTAARVGVICHSNKLPPQVRISVEKLMAKCAPRIIVATTTLGQGVNIGISSAIVATTSIGQSKISKRDFWNICGRAGRAFVDGEGKVLFAMDMTGKPWQVNKAQKDADAYFDIAHLDQVESGLLKIVGTLRQLAESVGISFEVLLELSANDSFDTCGQKKLILRS